MVKVWSKKIASTKTASDQKFGPYWPPAVLRMLGLGLKDCSCDRERLWYERRGCQIIMRKSFGMSVAFCTCLGWSSAHIIFFPSNDFLSQPWMTFLSGLLCQQSNAILIIYLCHQFPSNVEFSWEGGSKWGGCTRSLAGAVGELGIMHAVLGSDYFRHPVT